MEEARWWVAREFEPWSLPPQLSIGGVHESAARERSRPVGVASAIGGYATERVGGYRTCWWVAQRGHCSPCAEVNAGLPYQDRGQ